MSSSELRGVPVGEELRELFLDDGLAKELLPKNGALSLMAILYT